MATGGDFSQTYTLRTPKWPIEEFFQKKIAKLCTSHMLEILLTEWLMQFNEPVFRYYHLLSIHLWIG